MLILANSETNVKQNRSSLFVVKIDVTTNRCIWGVKAPQDFTHFDTF
jgi:hypothetical protein